MALIHPWMTLYYTRNNTLQRERERERERVIFVVSGWFKGLLQVGIVCLVWN